MRRIDYYVPMIISVLLAAWALVWALLIMAQRGEIK